MTKQKPNPPISGTGVSHMDLLNKELSVEGVFVSLPQRESVGQRQSMATTTLVVHSAANTTEICRAAKARAILCRQIKRNLPEKIKCNLPEKQKVICRGTKAHAVLRRQPPRTKTMYWRVPSWKKNKHHSGPT